MTPYILDGFKLILTGILIFLNGFFVAAEFALVKVRKNKLDVLVKEKRLFANTANWLLIRQDASLSTCQLGITMASLGLGWIGEPALAHLLGPVVHMLGITSDAIVHGIAFTVAFGIITTLHITIGEQVPKIYGIRRPETVFLWCAVPLKFFYITSYPFMILLNDASNFMLRHLGIVGSGHHVAPPSQDELQSLLSDAHVHGELSRRKHDLIDAAFDFEDQICRRIMVPRFDVVYIDLDQPISDNMERIKASKHTRFPLCRGSLDEPVGVVHLKDLFAISAEHSTDLEEIARPANMVPETTRISKLLNHFKQSKSHLALVTDEYGSIAGIVTMENILEQIVGPIQDEFDEEEAYITPDGSNRYIVLGNTPIHKLNKALKLDLRSRNVDTLSGLTIENTRQTVKVGDIVELETIKIEILELDKNRVVKACLVVKEESEEGADDDVNSKEKPVS